MHLDMKVVNFFRLSQFYDTLFELPILYRASGWGICTPLIWLSIKICCRVVENVTFPHEIYALKSICILFLVKYRFCIKLPFFCSDMIFEFSQKWQTSKEKIFELKNIPSPIFLYVSIKVLNSKYR